MSKKLFAVFALFFACGAGTIAAVKLVRHVHPNKPAALAETAEVKIAAPQRIAEDIPILRADYFFSSKTELANLKPFVPSESFSYTIPDEIRRIVVNRPARDASLPNFFDDEKPELLAKKIVNAMTAEELLAQVFMFGWAGQNPSERVESWVAAGLGSIKIFGWNTADSKKLSQAILHLQTRSLQSRFSIPLFAATDQEGGRVRHVKGLTSQVPSALACGASALPRDAFFSGYYIGRELAAIGINVNFAPTVDLYTNLHSTVIASRSFGDNPKSVARLATAFSEGLHAAGLLSTAKHFPGHGDTEADSHGRLPRIDITRKVFYERELEPFRATIAESIPLIMAGHLNFPQLMPENMPATFSYDIITRLLRGELGFSGLIVTDDMMMHSALHYAGNFSRSVTLALQAGNNIVESSTTPSLQDPVWTENIALMKRDKTFFAAVQSSAERIILKKLQYFKSVNHVPILPKPENLKKNFPVEGADYFFQSFAARAATLIPLPKGQTRTAKTQLSHDDSVLVVSDYPNLFRIAKNYFKESGFARTDELFLRTRNYEKIIFCVYDSYSAGVLKTMQTRFPEKQYFIISVLSPVFLQDLRAETAIAVYSYADVSFKAALACLCGDVIPKGVLPLKTLQF